MRSVYKNGSTAAEGLVGRTLIENYFGIAVQPVDHEVTKSLYFQDPDGNGVELYVDASDAWRQEPQRVAQAAALEL